MKCKLLSVEIEYDAELDNVEIVTKYGKNIRRKGFYRIKRPNGKIKQKYDKSNSKRDRKGVDMKWYKKLWYFITFRKNKINEDKEIQKLIMQMIDNQY